MVAKLRNFCYDDREKEVPDMTLGEKIRACRQEAGMSQEKIAELVGVSRQAVTKWEADQSVPHTEHLFRLSEIFGTTVDLLLPCREAGGARAEQLRCLTSEVEKRAGEKSGGKSGIS